MRNLGKEAKTLILGITIVCVLSLLFAFGISSVLTKNFQSSLVNHDYGVAGYLLNHDDAYVLSAFTDERVKRTFFAASMRCLYLGITKPLLSDYSRQFPHIRIKSCCPCVVCCFWFLLQSMFSYFCIYAGSAKRFGMQGGRFKNFLMEIPRRGLSVSRPAAGTACSIR